MQEVIILKESEEIKVTACLQEEELVISLLDKISGGFYKSTFIYDALPKIIHQQTDNIRELLEFLVYKKEEINYKNQLVELQIECGLLRKRKIAELYLQKQEAIPTEVFQRQMQSFRNNTHRLVQQTQQQKRKSQALIDSLKQKQLEIARLQTFISDLKKTQMQKVKIIEQNHISLTKMKTKIDQQQGKIIALFNQVQSERERSIKFIQYPKEMREIQYQQQKQLLERQKKIKELQTYNKLAERRNIELQRQSNKYQHLYQQASKERMRLLSERNFKEALSQARGPQQTYSQVYEYPIQKDCLQLQPKNRKQACRSLQIGQSGQMDLIAEQSQESFLTNHQEERIIDHKDNNVRQNSHINHHVKQKKPKKSDKSSVRGNLSEIKSRKSEEHTYLPLKFNIQEYSTKQKEQISTKNVLRALNGKDLTLLYSEQPFRRQGMQSCLVQVEQTNGKDLYIGLSVQKNDVNDELKLYMRGDGMISCRGRPASPNCKKKSIGNGDIVEFKLNFKLELLTIKVAGDTAANFQLPKQFVTRDVYFFVKLINSASIKYFGY